MAAIFQPTLLDWLFGGGIGTNIGASIFWALIAGAGGWWLKGHLTRFHHHLLALRASHSELHAKLNDHANAIEALHQRVAGDARGARPSPPPGRPAPPRPG
jgi:hypothetical protein